MKVWLERAAIGLHSVHGSRGLFLGALGLLALTLADPAIPRDVDRTLLTAPVFLVLVLGLVTLPREAVAAQQRARSLLEADEPERLLARRLWWPFLLVVLLAPRVFLAAYGIPHMNPLTGVITPGVQRQITVAFLFFVLLLPVIYLRASRRYAPHIVAKRPAHLPREDRSHQDRDLLLLLGFVLLVAWAWLLRPFWAPFSLIEWLPSLTSLEAGPRGVASITFAVAIPLILWTTLVAHLALLNRIVRTKAWDRPRVVALAASHLLLAFVAIILHVYDLLWIAQYRSAVGF